MGSNFKHRLVINVILDKIDPRIIYWRRKVTFCSTVPYLLAENIIISAICILNYQEILKCQYWKNRVIAGTFELHWHSFQYFNGKLLITQSVTDHYILPLYLNLACVGLSVCSLAQLPIEG